MDTSREEDIFEINDFTNATPWETFIADIEKVLHQWGLAASDEHLLDDPGRQHYKSERLVYAGRRFVMTLVVTGDSDKVPSPGKADVRRVDEHTGAWSPAMLEMMDSRGDFPSSEAHNITKWYGVKQFVLLSPDEGVECLTSQAQAKLMLSSVSIAISNTQCVVPFFIQTHKKWRHLYVGMAEGEGIRVNFDTIHLKQAPSKFMHLSGVMEMFKSKIGPGGHQVAPVHLSVRYTYIIKQWSLDDWPVELPEDVDEDRASTHFKTLPVGAFSDPISEFHLCAVWPNLSEEVIVDRDSRHTDLRPTHAPLWTVTTHLGDKTECYLSDCLQSFLKICYRDDTLGQLIGSERDSLGSSPHFSHALDKLTNASVSSINSPFLSSVVYSASQRLEFGIRGDGSLSDKKLEGILKCLFPDAYDLPVEEVMGEREGKLKSSPEGSLSRQLATVLCIVNNDNGLRGFAELWNETVQELRYRWDQAIPVNSLPDGSPDMGSCLFHQKLQMLNCCIQHKKKRENSMTDITGAQARSSKTGSDSKTSHSESDVTPNVEDSDTDDEFFEALESQDQTTSVNAKRTSKVKEVHLVESESSVVILEDPHEVESSLSGVLKRCGDLVLVATGEPLYIPITQEHTPMTEDMMWEQQNILSRLGTSKQAARVRAKMQSTSLLSDMQAFKAANPGSLLEDFVRWYSPRDWIEESTPPGRPKTSVQKDNEGKPTSSTSEEGKRHDVCGREEQVDPKEASGARIDSSKSDNTEDVGQVYIGGDASRNVVAESEEQTGRDQTGGGNSTEKEETGNEKVREVDQSKSKNGTEVEKEAEGAWEDDGWGHGDWEAVMGEKDSVSTGDGRDDTSAKISHRYCKGRLSERMLLSDNLWVETWKQATSIPTHKQVRLFNDTKEAEKVLHYFANMKPCELAIALMPLLLHSSVEVLQKRQKEGSEIDKRQAKKKSLARVDGLLTDVLSMLGTVQHPSLEVLPLYQECIGLLSQAEHLLASAQSLRNKLHHGINLAGGGHGNEADIAQEVGVCTEMMLEGPELVIRDPMNSIVGVAMKGLLESQGTYQVLNESSRSHGHRGAAQSSPVSTSSISATKREFILRTSSPCPAPHSRVCPHRMFCSLQGGVEFRVAGAFSCDTNFR